MLHLQGRQCGGMVGWRIFFAPDSLIRRAEAIFGAITHFASERRLDLFVVEYLPDDG